MEGEGEERARGGKAETAEIPFWIFGQQKWVSGINKNTTCSEVVSVLFSQLDRGEGEEGGDPLNPGSFGLVEKWRKIERPLGPTTKLLRVWQAWGEDKTEVRLVVKRTPPPSPSSPPNGREEGRVRKRRSRAVREERRKGDTLHPKSLDEDKEKCRDSIQRLMRVIITQGTTIQNQLAGLREKEEAIDTFEDRMHQVRVAESGRDYLLATYLGHEPAPPLAPQPLHLLSVSPPSRRREHKRERRGHASTPAPGGVQPDQVSLWTECLENLCRVNVQLTAKEEEMVRLSQRSRRLSSRPPSSPRPVVPELEELLSIPQDALQRELCLSREEVETLIAAITSTMDESRKVECDLLAIQERQAAGDIYIRSLLTDLQSAEHEGDELQREFDWILTLPPSAFASPEMLDWLRRDLTSSSTASNCGDTDSELGLELSQSCQGDLLTFSSLPETSIEGRHILLPDQVHPSPNTSLDPARSSSTGSTSSGFSSDIHSLQSPEPMKPPLPPKRVASLVAKFTSSPSSPPLFSSSLVRSSKLQEDEDCNSDTGLSSLNSSGEDQYQFDTLV